jgi:hypothetical protein
MREARSDARSEGVKPGLLSGNFAMSDDGTR